MGYDESCANPLTVDISDGVALVTLARPQSGNALSLALQQELVDTFARLGEDPEVAVVVLTGAGPRVFCAGLDLAELEAGTDLVNAHVDPATAIAQCRRPVIAAVNGAAVTGGLELVLACDFAIASRVARFADTHVRMGVIPGWGLSQRLSRAVGLRRATELSLTGRFLDAETACSWGLVNSLHEPDDLLDHAFGLARMIAAGDSVFISRYRSLIRRGAQMGLDAAVQLEAQEASAHNSALDPVTLSSRGARRPAR